MPTNGKTTETIGGVVKSVVVILTLLAPIAGAMYIYFEGEARHARNVEEIRNDFGQRLEILRRELATTRSDLGLGSAALAHHASEQKILLSELRSALDEVRNRFDTHGRLGVDSLPHPAGVLARLKDLERRIERLLQNTDDRWRSKDMKAWAKLLSATNEALNVPPVENGNH